MKATRYKRNAPINLPKSRTFHINTAINANPKCHAITVRRRIADMMEAGEIIRVRHGVYRKIEEQNNDMSLFDFAHANDAKKARALDVILESLVNEGIVTVHDDKYSVA